MMTAGHLYHKIAGPLRRHIEGPLKNQLVPGAWTHPEFRELADTVWLFREKLDGTNIRVRWDGHEVFFGGRTNRAQLPAPLLAHLQETFTEAVFEDLFGETSVTFYGEGIGPGIQKGGGRYSPTQTFALFDVCMGNFFPHDEVNDIAARLGIPVAPIVHTGTLHSGVGLVSEGLTSRFGEFEAEGIVGTPHSGLLTRYGQRIIVKIKAVDFRQADLDLAA